MSTDTVSLDKIDMKIIQLLQHNARMSIAELADKVGLSATPIKERMRRLQDQGVITGYTQKETAEALGVTQQTISNWQKDMNDLFGADI